MAFLDPTDLEPFASIDWEKAEAMIEDAEAMAVLVAPCITDDGFTNTNAVRAILRGAVLRWNDAGSGALSAQTVTRGPFGESQTYDTRQDRRGMFWPGEITQLQSLCSIVGGSVYTTSLGGPDEGDGYWSRPDTWTPA